jgi:hypothetical protein
MPTKCPELYEIAWKYPLAMAIVLILAKLAGVK